MKIISSKRCKRAYIQQMASCQHHQSVLVHTLVLLACPFHYRPLIWSSVLTAGPGPCGVTRSAMTSFHALKISKSLQRITAEHRRRTLRAKQAYSIKRKHGDVAKHSSNSNNASEFHSPASFGRK